MLHMNNNYGLATDGQLDRIRASQEDARERLIERLQDALDRRFLTSDMSEAEYKRRCAAIERDAVAIYGLR